jgi:hypothetical protein
MNLKLEAIVIRVSDVNRAIPEYGNGIDERSA